MKQIYLDYNATTPVDPRVVEEMLPFLNATFGNPSSIHIFGQKANSAVSKARIRVADFIGANPNEIIFTSGGTEANILAILGTFNSFKDKVHIITTEIEHSSIFTLCKQLQLDNKAEITFIGVDRTGKVDISALKNSIQSNTVLVSVMLANNEFGTVQDIGAIGQIMRERDIIFHTDAVQAVGKIPVNVDELKVDLLTISSHKIYGPKGVVALYIRNGLKLAPLFYSGTQEKKLRPGTENVSGIVGFGKACELAQDELTENMFYMEKISKKFLHSLQEKLSGVSLNGHSFDRIYSTCNLSVKNTINENLLVILDLNGVSASIGSACASGNNVQSRSLKALGLSQAEINSSIRFSLGKYLSENDVEEAVNIIVTCVKKIRGL